MDILRISLYHATTNTYARTNHTHMHTNTYAYIAHTSTHKHELTCPRIQTQTHGRMYAHAQPHKNSAYKAKAFSTLVTRETCALVGCHNKSLETEISGTKWLSNSAIYNDIIIEATNSSLTSTLNIMITVGSLSLRLTHSVARARARTHPPHLPKSNTHTHTHTHTLVSS